MFWLIIPAILLSAVAFVAAVAGTADVPSTIQTFLGTSPSESAFQRRNAWLRLGGLVCFCLAAAVFLLAFAR